MTALAYSLSKVKSVSLQMPEINWRKIFITLILAMGILMFFSLLFYVFQINKLTEGSYMVKGYEKEINNLLDENAKLQTNLAKTEFLAIAKQKAVEMNFIEVKKIKYIQVIDTELARAK